ncbi:uncharacterized protein IL334_003477 [Kwoniella shivajii]|uniref:Kinesin motor domain-containing protein n=1 Tax=Kwoniella shivajii TaxID=564305 RepID=A0ABZ1CXN8_9TREE|nr:hypothetical protein IL334_003477 [Kwoniella shivajii]
MSLSPSKRTLSRQPSSPSLAVGIPPALPESNIMQPSSPSKMSKSKSRKRIHRGDVSSSAASSEDESATPKRKILNPIDAPLPPSTGIRSKQKMTLQERLAAAASAKAESSGAKGRARSITDISCSVSEPATLGENLTSIVHTRSEILPSRHGGSASDKVVVCVRIKPTHSPFANVAYAMSSTSLTLSDEHPKVKQRGGKAGREDDKLLRFPSTTPELYEEKVAPLVDKAMNGFNSTIFAYGQTGSGKSFTMDTERAFLLRVSYIEIYNETLRDLLNFKKGPLKDDEKPAIHLSKGKVYVDPLMEEIVSTPQDVIDLLDKGNAQRRIGATDWNERSSRSHCVFTIVIESRPRDGDGDEDIRLSRLDLAGSEKAVSDSERRGEGKHINQSLARGHQQIDRKNQSNTYTLSKLETDSSARECSGRRLQYLRYLHVKEEHCAETLETLKFAGRCSQVKTNAKKNILQSSERALIKAKDEEIEGLKQRLAGLTNGIPPAIDPISDLVESVAAMEARKSRLITQLAKLNGEILTSELPRSGSILPLSPPKPKRRRISDFSALMAAGSSRMGLGLGTPKKTIDRRAISGMARVTEEGEEMAGIMGTLEKAAGGMVAKSFDQDRALAAARRNLAAKEEELALANRNLASALARASQLSERDAKITSLEVELRQTLRALSDTQQSLQRTEAELQDKISQSEGNRTELVSTIEDKTKRIDELESKIFDLRNSREELVIEDQIRLDKVHGDMVREKQELQSEIDRLKKQADASQLEKEESVRRLESEIASGTNEHASARAALEAKAEEYKISLSTVNAQLNDLVTFHSTQISNIQTEKGLAERQRDEARADLDRFQQEAMSQESNVLAGLREEIGNLRRARDEDKVAWEKQRLELEGSISEEKKLSGGLVQQLVQSKSNISQAEERESRLKEELAEALKTMSAAAGTLREQLQSSENDRLHLTTKLESALKTIDLTTKANSQLEDRLRTEMEATVSSRLAEAGGAAKQLQAETAARTSAETRLAELVLDNQDKSSTISRLSVQLTSSKVLEEKLLAAQNDLEVQEKRLESETVARQDAERRITKLAQLAAQGETEKEKLLKKEQGARIEAEKRVEQLAGQRVAALEGIKEMRTKLDSEVAARKEAEQVYEEKVETANRQLRKATGQVASLSVCVKEKDDLVRAAALAREEVEHQLKHFTKVHLTLSSALEEKNDELEALRIAQDSAHQQFASLSSQTKNHTNLEDQLHDEIAARKAAELHLAQVSQELVTKHESAQQILEEELFSLRQLLVTAQKEASDMRAETNSHRENADRLSSDLANMKSRDVTITSISSRVRHSAPDMSNEPRRSASGNHVSLLNERGEIERLEKIIEVQKEIIDEQRERIERWAKEMEKQREFVRLLTNDNSNAASAQIPLRANSPRGHGKSHSISHSPIPSNLPGTKGLVSTFTARNLALPTSPSPLPMHPTQFNNISSKRSRRVTIEHDIDRLTETSSVNKAKAIFESPDKQAVPSTPPKIPLRATHSVRSAPRRRRP